MIRLLAKLFGCKHRNYSRVFGSYPHTYVVCHDCLRRVAYDWRKMRIA